MSMHGLKTDIHSTVIHDSHKTYAIQMDKQNMLSSILIQ